MKLRLLKMTRRTPDKTLHSMLGRRSVFAVAGFALIANAIEIVSSNAGISQAQIIAAFYGTLLGNADACGLTVQRWHAEAMGQKISKPASNDDDRELAIDLVRSMAAEARKSPTMTCDEVRASLKQSENELR